MDWLFYIILGIFCVAWIGFAIVLSIWIMIVFRYLQYVVRIFQERPIFAIPRGSPPLDANDIVVETPNGKIKACYLPSHIPRKGVVLFGIEYICCVARLKYHGLFLNFKNNNKKKLYHIKNRVGKSDDHKFSIPMSNLVQ